MKNSIIKYGFYGLVNGLGIFLATILFGKGLSHFAQEVFGYTSMVVSLSFVFFGIKHYRDKENNGVISLGKAIVLGLLISVLVGIGVGIADYIYTTAINPDFTTEYLEARIKTMESTLSPEEINNLDPRVRGMHLKTHFIFRGKPRGIKP